MENIQLGGWRIVSFRMLQEEILGQQLFDEYYNWLQENPLVFDIQINGTRCDVLVHVEKFLQEKGLQYSIRPLVYVVGTKTSCLT